MACPEVIYIAEKVGPVFRGLVIDQRTQEALARTATYASAETAKSAAASMWRVMQKLDAEMAA